MVRLARGEESVGVGLAAARVAARAMYEENMGVKQHIESF